MTNKVKKGLSPGLLKYQAEQRAKKEAAAKGLSEEEVDKMEQEEIDDVAKEAAEAKAEAEKAAKKAVAAGAIKCSRCALVFEKTAARASKFGVGCPVCGFPIRQK